MERIRITATSTEFSILKSTTTINVELVNHNNGVTIHGKLPFGFKPSVGWTLCDDEISENGKTPAVATPFVSSSAIQAELVLEEDVSIVSFKPIGRFVNWRFLRYNGETNPKTEILLRALDALHAGDIFMDEIMAGGAWRFHPPSMNKVASSAETEKLKNE